MRLNQSLYKFREAIAILMILLVILLPIETADALTITNVNVSQVSNRYAIISWETDEISNSVVKYDSTNTMLALSKTDSKLTKNHSVMLYNLLNGTQYFFEVKSTNENGTAVANNSNAYYNFTTDAVDTKPPFIIADLPRYNAGTTINIEVQTEPNALVVIYVNGNSSRSRVVDATGHYIFNNVRLTTGENNVEIVAQDPYYPSNPETRKSFLVYADTSPPDVTYEEPVKKAYGQLTVTFKGHVEDDSKQPVNMWFYVNGNLTDTKENLSSPWQTTVNFIDGFNDFRVVAEDVAGNRYDYTFEDIWVDTTPLKIEEDNLDEISPAYLTYQTVKGKVNKPRAKIIVLVNNKTSSGREIFSTSVSDLVGSIHSLITKGELNYDVVADENGFFSLDVKLEQEPKLRVTQQNIHTANYLVGYTLDMSTGEYWLNEIKIIAIDENELWQDKKEKFVVYTKCGAAGDWIISGPLMIMPNSLPESLFTQGFAQFRHDFQLKWNGPAKRSDVSINSMRIVLRSGLDRSMSERLRLERNIFQSPIIFPGPPYISEKYYATYKLAPLTEELNKSKDFKERVAGTPLEFPVQLEVSYSYLDSAGRPVQKTQVACWDIQVSIIHPENMTQFSKFLADASKFFEERAKELDKLSSIFGESIKATTGLCFIGLLGVNPVFDLIDRYISDCKEFSPAEIQEMCGYGDNGDVVVTGSIPREKDEVKAKNCCNKMGGLLNRKKYVNYVCDRIFCPSVPNLNYHNQTFFNEIVKKNTGISDSSCAKDQNSGACKAEFENAWESAFLIDFLFGSEYEAAEKATSSEQINVPTLTTDFCSATKKPQVYFPPDITDYIKNQYVFIVDNDGRVKAGICKEYSASKKECINYAEGPDLDVDSSGICKSDACDQYFGLKNRAIPAYVQSARGLLSTNKYVLNPTRSVISSGAAVCLPALKGHIDLLKNIFNMASRCFKTVAETGKGDPGMCQESMSIILCDLALEAIKCGGSLIAGGWGSGENRLELPIVSDLAKQISSAAETISLGISGRYGTTNAYQTLFNERKIIHSVCGLAFGRPFDYNAITNSFTESFEIPTSSMCYIHPATRRFLGSDPLNLGKTTFSYEGSAVLAAGADLNWEAQLVCSSSNECSHYGTSSPGGKCDCSYGRGEQTYVVKAGTAKKGDIVDISIPQVLENYDYRFDKIRVKFTWTDQNGEVITGKCEAKINEIVSPPISCTLDSNGFFRCVFDVVDSGIAYFIDGPSPLKDQQGNNKVYRLNDELSFLSTIEVRSPNPQKPLPKLIGFEIFNKENVKVYDSYPDKFKLLDEGIKTYVLPKIPLKQDMFGKAPTISFEKRGNGGFKIGNLQFESIPQADTAFAIIFENNGADVKYKCVQFSEQRNQIKFINSDKTAESTSAGKTHSCNGIKFTVYSVDKQSVTKLKDSTYDGGDMFIIKIKKEDFVPCTGEKQYWKVIATLYYAEEKDGKISPIAPVQYLGQEQKKEFNIEVICGEESTVASTDTEKPKINSIKALIDDKECNQSNNNNISGKNLIKISVKATDNAGINNVYIKINGTELSNLPYDQQIKWIPGTQTYEGSIKGETLIPYLTNTPVDLNITVEDTSGNKVEENICKIKKSQ